MNDIELLQYVHETAEMVIQGNTMGATKSTRHLGDYAGGNREIRNLAERLLHTEEANAAQMKQFL
mgnify:CR=1 FL=1